MSKKADSYLLFASLSSSLALGESLIPLLAKSRVKLIVLANDIGESQKKKFQDKAMYYNVPVVFYKNKIELGAILRKSVVSALGITDKNLASAFLKAKEGEINGKKEN